jgi:hypothetical protein
MMDEPPITPLTGQLAFPQLEPEIPPTRRKELVRAWHAGKAAAIAGQTLVDCPPASQIERRGYGSSIAARRAHLAYARQWQRFWRDGFQSVGLFGARGADGGLA